MNDSDTPSSLRLRAEQRRNESLVYGGSFTFFETASLYGMGANLVDNINEISEKATTGDWVYIASAFALRAYILLDALQSMIGKERAFDMTHTILEKAMGRVVFPGHSLLIREARTLEGKIAAEISEPKD